MLHARAAVLTILLAVLSVSAAALNNHDPITQGEFAVLLADRANFPDPAGGWTPAAAIPALRTLKVTPVSGVWEPEILLNERNLIFIFHHFGITLYTVDPDHTVTVLRATMLLNLYRDMFYHHIWSDSSSEVTTTHIETGVGGDIVGIRPRPPSSPEKPCSPCDCHNRECMERYGLLPKS